MDQLHCRDEPASTPPPFITQDTDHLTLTPPDRSPDLNHLRTGEHVPIHILVKLWCDVLTDDEVTFTVNALLSSHFLS